MQGNEKKDVRKKFRGFLSWLKMAALYLQEKIFAWKVQGFPVIYDKKEKTSKCEIWCKISIRKFQKT